MRLPPLVIVWCLAAANLTAQATKTEFTLKNIFPKDGLFGPSATRMEYSYDGRFAAWLHRDFRERRHGNDLALMNVRSGKIKRITMASVMGKFQAATRKVIEYRKKEAVRDAAKLSKKERGKLSKAEQAQRDRGDFVAKGDFKDKKAPRYQGISSYTWSPTAGELLFTSGNDIYRYQAKSGKMERLTRTVAKEQAVKYLPNGKGYTYMLDSSLRQVTFGSHLIQQLNPKLPDGESMRGYQLSPDGKRLVFLARKGASRRSGGRKVKIARYRDRFMEVKEVPRHVSDDPMPKSSSLVYLFELANPMSEENKPVLVYSHTLSGPRDILRVPKWSPDSQQVAFAVFEQKTGHVNILRASFPPPPSDKPKAKAAKVKSAAKSENKSKPESKKTKSKDDQILKHAAKVAYRFLHNGGPTTPAMMQPEFLADSSRIVFLSEQTGFRHLHLLDPVYESQIPLTSGRFEVYPLKISKDHKILYVAATKEDSTCQDVYSIDLNNTDRDKASMKRLTPARGFYSNAAISPDGHHLLASFASYGSPRELVSVDIRRRRQKALTASHPEHALALTKVKPKFFRYKNRHGQEIRGHLFKPKGFRKGDKRPLLIYVYGGPLGTRKQVVEGSFSSDSYFFAQYMTRQHGYVTCTIDPRGMSGYGGIYEKANFERVGKPQVEDLSDGVKYLTKTLGIDTDKVGIHGWSFGGFQTQMCLYTAPEVFKVGIAGAGPTEWENYNSWYSTGTIGNSRTGTPDLKKYSLLPLAKNLQGKLLLVHGMEDSNVLYQDTVRVYRELLKADKETLVELFLDPTGGHGLGGDVKRLNRARKYEEFLVRTLGSRAVKPVKSMINPTPAPRPESDAR